VFLFAPSAPKSLTILDHRLPDSLKTLVHAFIMSRVDYCNAVLAGSPQHITDTLRFVSGTHNFEHDLSRLLHDKPHWLNVPEQVQYKLAVTVHRCLQDQAPKYLVDHCIPVSDVASRQRLRSASRCFLTVPRLRRSTFGRRAFAVGGPMAWYSLPDNLRDLSFSSSSFWARFKKCPVREILVHSAQQKCFMILRYINLILTLTLTLTNKILYLYDVFCLLRINSRI